MKKVILLFSLIVFVSFNAQAQNSTKKMMETETIKLEQVSGEFTQKQITVKEGAYIFEIANNNVGHDVGFVLVPKGADISNPENHIQTAYVTQAVADGKSQSSKLTVLEKGEYYYFCPLNPTATDNLLTVE